MSITVSIRRHPVHRDEIIIDSHAYWWSGGGRGETTLLAMRVSNLEPEGPSFRAVLLAALKRAVAELEG